MDEEVLQPESQTDEEKQDEKSISADLIRGHINTIILRSLADGDKYGYEIIAEIERKSHGQYSLKQPSLYSALKRLEKDGYITSYWGGSVGGGRRKYFSLSEEGKAITEQNQAEWEYSRTIIDSLISNKDFDFSNPPPSLVNMRVLRDTTTRVPTRESEEESCVYAPSYEEKAEQERLLNEARQKLEEAEAEQLTLARERAQLEETLKNERTRFEELLRERDERFFSAHEAHERELEDVERRVRAEDEQRFRRREQELIHNNYLSLVNTPPAPAQKEDFDHYSAPVAVDATEEEAKEQTEQQPVIEFPQEDSYREVIHQLYSNTVRGENTGRVSRSSAQSLDGIDFADIEALAARDHITVTTSSGQRKKDATQTSKSIVHKGKALFLSALLVFFLCIAEGSIVLAMRKNYTIPVFFPYLIWGVGLALLLATGLAYANHYGQRALRRNSPALINAIVIYVISVILVLIIALVCNVDFKALNDTVPYLAIPIVVLFGIIVFGIAYYLQVRPKKK